MDLDQGNLVTLDLDNMIGLLNNDAPNSADEAINAAIADFDISAL